MIMRRTIVALLLLAAVAPAAFAQERVVDDERPLPGRAADAPHPDAVVSADQLVRTGPPKNTKRNIELVIGLIFICALLAFAVFRSPRSR